MNGHLLEGFLTIVLSRWLVVFILSIIISWVIMRYLFERNYGIVLTVANFIFVSIIAMFIFMYRQHESVRMLWFVHLMFNLPTSLFFSPILAPIHKIVPNSYLIRFILIPYIICLLLGTFQYYVIGRIIDSIISKRKKRKNVNTGNVN